MCFVLFVAADSSISDIPFDENAPGFNIRPLTEHETPVQQLFSKPFIKSVGSSTHCGCGFRHLSFQKGGWPEEDFAADDCQTDPVKQIDHQSLHQFLIEQLKGSESIELYGCWCDDLKFPPARHETIQADDVSREKFFLRERCHYMVVVATANYLTQ